MTAQKRNKRKTMIGEVVSSKMQKTVAVKVKRDYRHPLYKKVVRSVKKYLAHVEDQNLKVGDKVLLMETRPLSRRKRFRVVEVFHHA